MPKEKKDVTERPYFKDNRLGHEKAALAAVYALIEFAEAKKECDVEQIVSGICGAPYEDCPIFVKACVLSCLKHFDEAVEAYEPLLRNWSFGRLNRVAQAILLVCYCRYYHSEESVAKAILIDWAVERAKEYLAKDDYKYINAVLDKALG